MLTFSIHKCGFLFKVKEIKLLRVLRRTSNSAD
jgi:hypothetical protein